MRAVHDGKAASARHVVNGRVRLKILPSGADDGRGVWISETNPLADFYPQSCFCICSVNDVKLPKPSVVNQEAPAYNGIWTLTVGFRGKLS